MNANTPNFVVRAPDPSAPRNRPRWVTVGYAWDKHNADTGEVYYSVKLNTVPVGNGWDGALLLLPYTPRENGAEPAQ